ncbi:MAG: hypothetical protein AAFW00_14795 [Bacteroidota bacterium]
MVYVEIPGRVYASRIIPGFGVLSGAESFKGWCETPGGLKAVMVPLSDTQSLIVESRLMVGFAANLEKEGLLVYAVNTSKERGTGPIVVKPGVTTTGTKKDALMAVGDTYTYEGVSVEVLDSKAGSDVVRMRL